MKKQLRRLLPDAQSLRQRKGLGWLAPWLGREQLWYLSRHSVALGMALGVFFGLLTPFAQILLAVMAAIALRANVAAAALSTLVTNPLTFAPIYYLAYRLGNFLLGGEGGAGVSFSGDASWWSDLSGVGKPLLLGLVLIALVLAPLVYLAVSTLWRLSSAWAWQRRKARRQAL